MVTTDYEYGPEPRLQGVVGGCLEGGLSSENLWCRARQRGALARLSQQTRAFPAASMGQS